MASYLTASHWLVSVPGQFGANQAINKFKSCMVEKAGRPLAEVTIFEMPVQQMRVGTLDTLMSLSDELARVDSAVESVVKKVERQVAESYNALKTQELLAKRRPDDETPINVPALGLRVAGKPVADYVTKFKWDSNTWDPREPLPELVKRISTASERIDADMRQYATAYQEKKTALQAAERKRSGNLMVASLDDIITPAALKGADTEWIGEAESEFMASVAVVVPKSSEEAFLSEYRAYAGDAVPVGPEGRREAEKTGPAVPGSARKIAEDKDGYVLYILVVLRKYVDAFRSACKDKRLTVRDFTYNPSAAGTGTKAAEALARETAAALNLLKDVSRARYEESMSLWLHIKCIRVFVESVLRYGLPVHFYPLLFRVSREGSSNAASTGKKLLDSSLAAWKNLCTGSDVLDESVAIAAAGDDAEVDDGKNDPVIAGVTDQAASSVPFVLLDFEVRTDTAAQAQK